MKTIAFTLLVLCLSVTSAVAAQAWPLNTTSLPARDSLQIVEPSCLFLNPS